ncbi:hypothetical protein CRUP_000688, partial [Coryphaenoides rupestris]
VVICCARAQDWKDDYRQFRTVFIYLLTGLEQYQHGKVREALSYLAHAYQKNAVLLRKGERRGLKQSVIALYRRKCLLALNESASRLFMSGDETEADEGAKLGEILPRVLDSSAEMVVLKDPPKVHGSFPHDLCSRLASVMESIRNTSIVIVK